MSHDPNRAQAEIIQEFEFFDDWMDRYQHLIDLGKELPDFPESDKTDANLLPGCQSNVWFIARGDQDCLNFEACSDAAIVSGLIALVLKIYSGASAEQILSTPPTFIEAIGLGQHLSATRANGLRSMLSKIKSLAEEALRSSTSTKT
jgi:cysteine desulfuration protein SufE